MSAKFDELEAARPKPTLPDDQALDHYAMRFNDMKLYELLGNIDMRNAIGAHLSRLAEMQRDKQPTGGDTLTN